MKIKYWKTAFIFSTLILMTSCDNDDDDDGANGQFDSMDVTSLQNSAQNGSWRISRFVDDGEDETSDFNGFAFSFGADGSISADNGSTVINGTWRVELDDDDDDMDDADDLEFIINFSTSNENFDDLEEDWYVLEYSDTRIRLADDDDDDDDDEDLLTFERN